jgi:hypothetical protein
VVDGEAEHVVDEERVAAFVDAVNTKYDATVTVEFQDPDVNGTYAVRPATVIALTGGDFPGSPTRWRFGPPGRPGSVGARASLDRLMTTGLRSPQRLRR